jgi:hypothetical protein
VDEETSRQEREASDGVAQTVEKLAQMIPTEMLMTKKFVAMISDTK